MKCWVDFSDMIQWPHQHLTGIQRVVIQVSLAMKTLEKEVGFFCFNPTSKSFFVVNPNSIEHALNSEMSKIEVTSKLAEFKRGERIYLLGGTWVYPDFVGELKKLKDQALFEVIQFIHDVTPIKVPHTHREKSKVIMETWLRQLDSLTDGYLTNSQFSRSEILEVFSHLGLQKKPFQVVRLGDQLEKTLVSSQKSDRMAPLKPGFVLVVSSIEPRKNHLLLYQAWKLLRAKYGERAPQLVMVGRAGWQSEDFRALMFRDPELKDQLIWLDQATEAELVWLYQNCQFTVYPSFYEGWGLPVAESLAYQKFCVASDAASIPEIAGSSIDYFNPFDSRDCFEKIEKCYFDPKYLEKREGESRRTFKVTSWLETAKHCLAFDLGKVS